MKLKFWIVSIILGIIIISLIISRAVIPQDILLFFLVYIIPTMILMIIEFFVGKRIPLKYFFSRKAFGQLIILTLYFGFILYLSSGKPILKKTAINDLDFMIESLENIHPDIYQEIPKDSFLQHYEREKENLPTVLSNVDFFATCARLNSLFKTGHTKPMANTILVGMQKFFRNNFPYEIKIIENRIFIINGYTLQNKIRVGSEIIELNGKNANQLINEWSRLASYENEAFRNHLITNRTHIGICNNFKTYNITYKEYGTGQLKKSRVNGGLISNLIYGKKKSKEKRPSLFYKELSPDIAYMGFFDCHDLETYKSFFKSTFTELQNKKTRNLIIDIRGNGGGHTVIGRELMQYIFHQSFTERDSSTRKISTELIATGKVKQKFGADKEIPGTLITTVFEPIELIDNPVRYNGNTYLLTNNVTFSAAQGFASSYKCYGNGTIIGEETGGVTVNFADVHFFVLPNTGLTMMTSWEKAYFPYGVDNNRGVIPDYIVYNSIDDYIQQKDKVLDFTIDLINNK